jgi:predicted nuclease of restriction endonuclease-like (RecB) superfamily
MEENKLMNENKSVLQPQEKLQPDDAYRQIRGYIIDSQKQVYSAVNSAMVIAYWNIGKEIYKICGENDRAAYGKQVLEGISGKLSAEFGNGFDISNLRKMRQFYLTFPNRDTLCLELSWSHYRLLMRVSDPKARDFYTEEAVKSGWSVRQLQRQINTMYYHRILASKDKSSVAAEIETTTPKPEYEKILKDPYVLEFLNLPANEHYYESNLEQALIDHLQKFLLELGRGFSFVSRQKHFVVDGRHFYIDLVFYNYILKCFVLIDLKIDDLTHQDIGQMQMYVNYYTRELMNEGDNPPIGILLCAEKSDTLVRYTLPEDNTQIYAAKYMPYLPTEEELKRELKFDEFQKLESEANDL